MEHEKMMEQAWRLISELGITESPQETDKDYLVENIHLVRDAFYVDIESGHDFEDDDVEAFFTRHGIEWSDPPAPVEED